MKAFAPNGKQIRGTLDTIPAIAEISSESYSRNANGKLEFDWDGETDVIWDDQKTV